MGQRSINIGLFLSFFICYLEWGGGNSGFVFQMEYSVLTDNATKETFTHPFIFIPLVGQLIMLFTVFQKDPNRKLSLIGLILMGVLVSMILLVGLLGLNIKIIASVTPFVVLSVLFFRRRHHLNA